jgi:myo-inositol-1(or 4)-monophosphatase
LTPDPLYLATAVEAALAAGQVQRRYFRQVFAIDRKGPIDLVTAADLEVEREFRQLVSARFPTHDVLGEEQGGAAQDRPPARYRWIIDPIDGTTNFAHGLALFCCSIALEIDGQVALGVVYDPMGEELFTAERGAGAWLNGAPLRVSSCDRLVDSLLCTGFPYSIHEQRQRLVDVFGALLTEAQGIRRLGSAALDLCYVAAGRLDGFWEKILHPWDMAAGALIVEEAGGRVTDYRDAPVDLFVGEVAASNGRIHRAMLDVIGRAEGRLP